MYVCMYKILITLCTKKIKKLPLLLMVKVNLSLEEISTSQPKVMLVSHSGVDSGRKNIEKS